MEGWENANLEFNSGSLFSGILNVLNKALLLIQGIYFRNQTEHDGQAKLAG